MATITADGKKSMTNYDIDYKHCSYYNGRLVIRNVPYLKFTVPAPTGETSTQDTLASLIISIVGDEFKENGYTERMIYEFSDLEKSKHIQEKVQHYYDMFNE